MNRTRAARLLTLTLLGAVLLFFWDAPAVWPLKILVVLFHELGHAAAALLTGGSVVSIGLSPDQGGVTWTRGGWPFLILNAGYLGSLIAGAGLLYVGRKPKTARRGAWVLVGILALATVLWVRPLVSFGFLFAALAAAALALVTRYGGDGLVQGVLRGLGVFSVLYALWDIRADVFSPPDGAVSDATMLAELTWIPAPVWGVAWLAAGHAVLWFARRWLV